MAERIINGTQPFNLTDFVFCAPKPTAQGGKSVMVLYKPTKTAVAFDTPLLLTWGLSDFKDEKGVGNGRFELSFQFPSDEYKTPESEVFLDNLKAFENLVKEKALENSREWFGKVHKNKEVVEALFTPMLKYSKNKETGDYDYSRPPCFRVKAPMYKDEWKTEVYDEEGNKLFPSENPSLTPLDFLKKGSNIKGIAQIAGIWFINGKFSISWKLVQAMVQKPRANLQGQCFLKLNTQDKEKLKAQVVVEEVDEHITGAVVDDSDADEEDEEEHEETGIKDVTESAVMPPPPPVPAPVAVAVAVAALEEPVKKKLIKKKA